MGARARSKFRSVTIPEDAKAEILLTMWRDQAKMFGIDPMKVKIEKRKERKREPMQKEEAEMLKHEIKRLRFNPQKLKDEYKHENKPVKENELEGYLNNGWEMLQTVIGKILVRKRA